jgi:hypothetical protein
VNIPKEDLESEFEKLLAELQSRRELLPLGMRIVREVWLEKTEQRRKAAARAEAEIRELGDP